MNYKNISLEKKNWLDCIHETNEITDISPIKNDIFDGYILKDKECFINDKEINIVSKEFDSLESIQNYILWDLKFDQRILLHKIYKNTINEKHVLTMYYAIINENNI